MVSLSSQTTGSMTMLTDEDIEQLIQDNLEHLSRFQLPRAMYPALTNSDLRDIAVEPLSPSPDTGELRFEAAVNLYRRRDNGSLVLEQSYKVTVPCRSARAALECLLLALAEEVRYYLENPNRVFWGPQSEERFLEGDE